MSFFKITVHVIWNHPFDFLIFSEKNLPLLWLTCIGIYVSVTHLPIGASNFTRSWECTTTIIFTEKTPLCYGHEWMVRILKKKNSIDYNTFFIRTIHINMCVGVCIYFFYFAIQFNSYETLFVKCENGICNERDRKKYVWTTTEQNLPITRFNFILRIIQYIQIHGSCVRVCVGVCVCVCLVSFNHYQFDCIWLAISMYMP